MILGNLIDLFEIQFIIHLQIEVIISTLFFTVGITYYDLIRADQDVTGPSWQALPTGSHG